jgi:hypothetical protein
LQQPDARRHRVVVGLDRVDQDVEQCPCFFVAEIEDHGRPPSRGPSTCGCLFSSTLTSRLQTGDEVLIAAAYTGFAFVRFVVQLLT